MLTTISEAPSFNLAQSMLILLALLDRQRSRLHLKIQPAPEDANDSPRGLPAGLGQPAEGGANSACALWLSWGNTNEAAHRLDDQQGPQTLLPAVLGFVCMWKLQLDPGRTRPYQRLKPTASLAIPP